jgi:hypothetical protein
VYALFSSVIHVIHAHIAFQIIQPPLTNSTLAAIHSMISSQINSKGTNNMIKQLNARNNKVISSMTLTRSKGIRRTLTMIHTARTIIRSVHPYLPLTTARTVIPPRTTLPAPRHPPLSPSASIRLVAVMCTAMDTALIRYLLCQSTVNRLVANITSARQQIHLNLYRRTCLPNRQVRSLLDNLAMKIAHLVMRRERRACRVVGGSSSQKKPIIIVLLDPFTIYISRVVMNGLSCR